MKRRKPIPGVDEATVSVVAGQFPSGSLRAGAAPTQDEAALAALAGQFPSGNLRPGAPPTQDNAPQPLGDSEIRGLQPVAPAAGAPTKAPGRGLAALALLVALVALLIAATSVMPPLARVWLTERLGDWRIVNLLTASHTKIDSRLDAAAQSIAVLAGRQDALAGKEGDVAARLDAVEGVVGSGAGTRRLDAVEGDLAVITQRLAAAGDGDRNAASRADALETRLAAFDGDLKAVQDKLAANEQEVNDVLKARLGVVEADVGALQKIDRRPEKLFMAALQLRDVVRTAAPFKREVAAAQALAGDNNADLNAALKVLAADADHGVATAAELRDNFTTITAPRLAALADANRPPAAERAWDWLQSLFTTAPPGTVGERNAALVALAARSLAQGQLEAAMQQLVLLEEESALVAAEWLKNASARLAADKAIATVMSQALDQLAASK